MFQERLILVYSHPRLVRRVVFVAAIFEIIVILVDGALFQIGHVFTRIWDEFGIGAAARHARIVAMLDDAADARPPRYIVGLDARGNVSTCTILATEKITQIVDRAKLAHDTFVTICGARRIAIVPRIANDTASQSVGRILKASYSLLGRDSVESTA
jgi:hypothetical protein